jgi:hypothetical protein
MAETEQGERKLPFTHGKKHEPSDFAKVSRMFRRRAASRLAILPKKTVVDENEVPYYMRPKREGEIKGKANIKAAKRERVKALKAATACP